MMYTIITTNYNYLEFFFSRLIRYNPKTKTNTVLMRNLHFANGIELSDDESFILVAETMKFRIHK